jgi:hypothetical protein
MMLKLMKLLLGLKGKGSRTRNKLGWANKRGIKKSPLELSF